MGKQEGENPVLGEDCANLDDWAGILWQDF